MEKTEDNPNPRASVAILCPYLFFAHAFESILRHCPDAEIVPDFTSKPGMYEYPPAIKERFKRTLAEKKLPWRDLESSGLTPGEFFSKYGTVVAPNYVGWAQHPVTERHHKMRVFYGGAKDLWIFGLPNVFFDSICTPGPFFTATLTRLYGNQGIRMLTTGEPKLDALASLTKEMARTALDITDSRPVVLVASTWGSLSVLKRVATALEGITDDFDVVLKVHHMVEAYEPETLALFKGSKIRLITEEVPIATALAAADVVISDSSGAIFDAVLADKPVLLLDVVGTQATSFYTETPFYGFREGRPVGVPTSPTSLDQLVKDPSYAIGPVLEVMALQGGVQLGAELHALLSSPERWKQGRALFKTNYFLPVDGNAGLRVAEEIARIRTRSVEEIAEEKGSMMRLLVRDYKERIKTESQDPQLLRDYALLKAQLDRFAHIKQLPYSKRMKALHDIFFS